MTLVPLGKSALQAEPHEIPAGALVTLPEPLVLTWRANSGVNVALTVCAAVIATMQVAAFVDWQAPPQAENTLP